MSLHCRGPSGRWVDVPHYPLMPTGLYLTDVLAPAVGFAPGGVVPVAFTCCGLPVFTLENRDIPLQKVVAADSVLYCAAGPASHGIVGTPSLLQLHRAPPEPRKRKQS